MKGSSTCVVSVHNYKFVHKKKRQTKEERNCR